MIVPKPQFNPLIDLAVFLTKRKQTLAEWLKENNFLTKEDLTDLAIHGTIHEFKVEEATIAEMIALLPDSAKPELVVSTEETVGSTAARPSRKKSTTQS